MSPLLHPGKAHLTLSRNLPPPATTADSKTAGVVTTGPPQYADSSTARRDRYWTQPDTAGGDVADQDAEILASGGVPGRRKGLGVHRLLGSTGLSTGCAAARASDVQELDAIAGGLILTTPRRLPLLFPDRNGIALQSGRLETGASVDLKLAGFPLVGGMPFEQTPDRAISSSQHPAPMTARLVERGFNKMIERGR